MKTFKIRQVQNIYFDYTFACLLSLFDDGIFKWKKILHTECDGNILPTFWRHLCVLFSSATTPRVSVLVLSLYIIQWGEAWCDSRLYLDSRARDIRGYRGISIMNNGIISAREIFIRDSSQQNISHQDWWAQIYSRTHKTDCNESCFDRENVTTSRGAGVTLSRVTRRVTPPALMSYLWRQVNNPPTWPGTRSNFTHNFPVKFKLDEIKMVT